MLALSELGLLPRCPRKAPSNPTQPATTAGPFSTYVPARNDQPQSGNALDEHPHLTSAATPARTRGLAGATAPITLRTLPRPTQSRHSDIFICAAPASKTAPNAWRVRLSLCAAVAARYTPPHGPLRRAPVGHGLVHFAPLEPQHDLPSTSQTDEQNSPLRLSGTAAASRASNTPSGHSPHGTCCLSRQRRAPVCATRRGIRGERGKGGGGGERGRRGRHGGAGTDRQTDTQRYRQSALRDSKPGQELAASESTRAFEFPRHALCRTQAAFASPGGGNGETRSAVTRASTKRKPRTQKCH